MFVTVFEKIKAGLEEALAYERGEIPAKVTKMQLNDDGSVEVLDVSYGKKPPAE